MSTTDLKIASNVSAGHQADERSKNGHSSERTYFERADWTLFRNLHTLGQKAGVPTERIPRLVVKELVDNALDVAGACKFGETLDDDQRVGFYVQDDGPGLPGTDEYIASLFSVSRPLASSKLLRLPTRGALGNGLRVVAGAVLASGGELCVGTRGRLLRLHPRDVDGGTDVENVGEWSERGTYIELRLGEALDVDDRIFAWATMAKRFSTAEREYKGRTSPWWYDSDSFYELLQASGERTVRDLVTDFEGCSGRKAGEVAADFKGRPCTSLSRPEVSDLLETMQWWSNPVNPSRLGRVGEEGAGLENAAYCRSVGTYETEAAREGVAATIPFVVEARAKESDEDSMVVYVNRTPITSAVWLTHMKPTTYRGLCGCNLSSEADNTATPVKVGKNRHYLFMVNITTPFMPITTDGKAPNLQVVETVLVEVMEKAVRKAKRKGNGSATGRTQKSVILDNLSEGIARNRGERNCRYSERNLFYTIRPSLLKFLDREPNWNTFKAVIRDHEAELGHDLPGIYRDSRGTLYHPHLREWFSLGTLFVESYKRPPWTFNKILYAEKGGFFPLLTDSLWPERNDCALVTSVGFASRAARDLLDLLGETEEDLLFFCIHDADGPGTGIYQALQEATKSRPARRVEVINLGLEPREALDMGLQVEDVKPKKGKVIPVADYVPKKWRKWLQKHRVELNAMDSPSFLAWLDAKMEPYRGKLFPPEPVMVEHLESVVQAQLRESLTDEAVRAFRVEEKVQAAFSALGPCLASVNDTLGAAVSQDLEEALEQRWVEPVERLASEVVQTNGQT